jgi:hypothetical protein
MIKDSIALQKGSQLLAEAVDPKTMLVAKKEQPLSHKSKCSRKIRVSSWKAKTRCYVRKCKIYLASRMTDSPIVNPLEQFQLGRAKSNIDLKLGSHNII